MSIITTLDLGEFGARELEMARDLLAALLASNLPKKIKEAKGLQLMLNTGSGCVFLTDDDYRVYMINGQKLEEFYTCPICGEEDFWEDIKDHGKDDAECRAWVKEITEDKKND